MAEAPKCPVDHTKAAAKPAGSCPVDHTRVATSTAPSSSTSSGGAAAASECPVDPSTRERYLQQQREQLAQQERIAQEAAALDPRNMMPAANQQPAPGQVVPLPTERQRSSIPKAGTEQNWEYPSEQMFYNALVRKGKLGDANENDMRAVVAIHNHTNERAWRELMRWEERHLSKCPQPKLVRFQGKFDELSPRAKFRVALGGIRPFDRHDWVIDRCGTEVRYIIDYYDTPSANSIAPESNIALYVRPAFDSPQAALDRTLMFMSRLSDKLFGK